MGIKTLQAHLIKNENEELKTIVKKQSDIIHQIGYQAISILRDFKAYQKIKNDDVADERIKLHSQNVCALLSVLKLVTVYLRFEIYSILQQIQKLGYEVHMEL